MNREEKNLITRKKIVDSAIIEFGTKSFNEASLNSIRTIGDVSKGIIYHYFKDKDELYLTCVEQCINSLSEYIYNEDKVFNSFEDDVIEYLNLRQMFLNDNPSYANIFVTALVQPPKHLIEDIKKIKRKLDEINVNYYRKALVSANLKDDITIDDAVDYFVVFQDVFNSRFQNDELGNDQDLFESHELKLRKILRMMFYGIVKEGEK